MRKNELQGLQSKIKSNAEQACRLNRDIQGAAGVGRSQLRAEKKSLGHETRDLLLAYAFLRGVPYKATEPHCEQKPSIRGITHEVKLAFPRSKVDVADLVSGWLSGSFVDLTSIYSLPEETSVKASDEFAEASRFSRVKAAIRSVVGL